MLPADFREAADWLSKQPDKVTLLGLLDQYIVDAQSGRTVFLPAHMVKLQPVLDKFKGSGTDAEYVRFLETLVTTRKREDGVWKLLRTVGTRVEQRARRPRIDKIAELLEKRVPRPLDYNERVVLKGKISAALKMFKLRWTAAQRKQMKTEKLDIDELNAAFAAYLKWVDDHLAANVVAFAPTAEETEEVINGILKPYL